MRVAKIALSVGSVFCSVSAFANELQHYQLAESANTSFGVFAVKRTGNADVLMLGNTSLKLINSGEEGIVRLVASAKVANKGVMLAYIATDNNRDSNMNCKLVVTDGRKINISSMTYCPNTSDNVIFKNDELQYSFASDLPYAEPDDVGIVTFDGNDIKIEQHPKSILYYQSKFSDYSAKQIYMMMGGDEIAPAMVEEVLQNHFWSRYMGSFGKQFCIPFNWMEKPKQDGYYTLLKPVCSAPIFDPNMK